MLFERHRQIPVCRTEHKTEYRKSDRPLVALCEKSAVFFIPKIQKRRSKISPGMACQGGGSVCPHGFYSLRFVAMIHRHATYRLQPVRMKESTHQRNRRERPVCRSGDLPGISPSDSSGAQPIRNKSFPRGKLARPRASLMRQGSRGGVKHSRNCRRIRRNAPKLSFRPQRQRSGGIHHVGKGTTTR